MVHMFIFCCLLGFTTQIYASSANHQLIVIYAGTNANLQCIYKRGFSNSNVTWHYGDGKNFNLTVSTNCKNNTEGTVDIISNVSLEIEGQAIICCSVTLTETQQNSTICKTVRAVQQHGIGSTISTIETVIITVGIVIVVVFILFCHRGFISRADQLMHNGYQRGVTVSRYSVSDDVKADTEERSINENDYYFSEADQVPLHGKEHSTHV